MKNEKDNCAIKIDPFYRNSCSFQLNAEQNNLQLMINNKLQLAFLNGTKIFVSNLR